MKQILNRYQFDDMVVCYEINDEKQVGLFLYPADMPLEKCANPDTAIDSLVSLKLQVICTMEHMLREIPFVMGKVLFG